MMERIIAQLLSRATQLAGPLAASKSKYWIG